MAGILIGLPGWVWLIPAVPEAGLLLALAWSAPRHRLEQMGQRRTVALALDGVITSANVVALTALIASLLNAHEKSGGELLLKGATIWSTNVITFVLLFWEFDRGGPIRRREPDPPPRDFQFPQDENPTLAEPNFSYTHDGRAGDPLPHERPSVAPGPASLAERRARRHNRA